MDIPLPHLLNLAAHIGAGIAAIFLGLALLARAKGTPLHHQRGLVFVVLTLLVCATGAIGNLVRVGQPWSQLLPSVLGMIVIVVLIVRERRPRKSRADSSSPLPQ